MRNILVSINHSSNSVLTADFAGTMADKIDARIELMYVQDKPVYDTGIMDGEIEERQHLIHSYVKNEPVIYQAIKPVFRDQIEIS